MMIGYLASHVGTGIPKEDNNYLLCLFCLVPVSSHRRIQHTRNEAREIVWEALGPGMRPMLSKIGYVRKSQKKKKKRKKE
jgi:hypothetical protein